MGSHPAAAMCEVAARLGSLAHPLGTFSELMVLHVATCRNLSPVVVSQGLGSNRENAHEYQQYPKCCLWVRIALECKTAPEKAS